MEIRLALAVRIPRQSVHQSLMMPTPMAVVDSQSDKQVASIARRQPCHLMLPDKEWMR